MDNAIVVFLAAALIVGAGVFLIIMMTRKSGQSLDRSKYQSAWLAIESSLTKDDISSAEMAVIKADNLVDKALTQRGYRGKTMGERMKAAQSVWSHPDHVWAAHKLRNRIAHEQGSHTDCQLSRQALAAFKQALKDLGAI